MKYVLIIILLKTVVVIAQDDAPLGETFVGDFGNFFDGDIGTCGIFDDYSDYKAAWISSEWFTQYGNDVCQYCLMVDYNGIREILPITDECPFCEKNLVLLSYIAFQEFAYPDVGIFDANATFVNCLGTTDNEILTTTKMSTILLTETSAKAVTDALTEVMNPETSSTLVTLNTANTTTLPLTTTTTDLLNTSNINSLPLFYPSNILKIFLIVLFCICF